jgi:hypothetical protein
LHAASGSWISLPSTVQPVREIQQAVASQTPVPPAANFSATLTPAGFVPSGNVITQRDVSTFASFAAPKHAATSKQPSFGPPPSAAAPMLTGGTSEGGTIADLQAPFTHVSPFGHDETMRPSLGVSTDPTHR